MSSFNEYMSKIRDIVDPSRPETLFDAAPVLSMLVTEGAITPYFNDTLTVENGLVDVTNFLANGTVLLYRTPDFVFGLELLSRRSKHLYYRPMHSISVVAAAALEVDAVRYVLDPEPDGGEVSKDSMLRRTEARVLRYGDAWMCDGRHEVEDIGVPDGVAVPMVRLVSAPVGGLEWTFDRDSLRPWNAMTVRHEGTYLTNLIDVLGAFRNKSSIDVLSYTSAHHPDHFVRWCAVKNIGRIDRQAALAALHARLDDRHPEVRRAAERTLARHTAAATV